MLSSIRGTRLAARLGEGESDGTADSVGDAIALGVALAVARAVPPDRTAISRPAATIVPTANAQTTTTTILFPAVARAINGRMRSITGLGLLGTKPANRVAGSSHGVFPSPVPVCGI